MPKILYVEDNEDNIYMMEMRLKRKGYEVSIARTGQECLDKALTESPNLVIIDVGLPVMDGYEVTRRLKEHQITKNIPIIILTAHALTSDKEMAYAAGADEYETKPVVMQNLLQKVEFLLKKKS